MPGRRIVLAALAAIGCDAPAPTPARDVTRSVGFDPAGLSAEIEVDVPPGTRSLTLVARGADDALLALARLTTADGIERVGLDPSVALPAALTASYVDEQMGGLGRLPQSARLGLFTHVYPGRPDDPLPPGRTTLRLATDRPGHPVEVRVLLPPDDGAAILPINVLSLGARSRYRAGQPGSVPWLDELAAIFRPAGVRVRVDRVINLAAGEALTVVSEPQEGPRSQSAALALRGAALSGAGLNVFVVDSLPPGLAGWSLGTPGPPIGGTIYSGVVLEDRDPVELGRVAAHEIAHYLGLRHVVDVGVSGRRYDDGLADTREGEDNLMAEGRRLTAGQAFILRRSALLERERPP